MPRVVKKKRIPEKKNVCTSAYEQRQKIIVDMMFFLDLFIFLTFELCFLVNTVAAMMGRTVSCSLPFLFLLWIAENSFGFTLSDKSVSKLLAIHSNKISSLKSEAAKIVGSVDQEPYSNDVFFLRYCLSDGDPLASLKENLLWRIGAGKSICDAAQSSIAEATSADKWNNEPVRAAAPHASIINDYITPEQCMTTTSNKGDLVYCIRAGKIDDTALMRSLGDESKLVDFFLYCKEVNAAVANRYSQEQDKLVCVLTANDLSGVRLVGGSKEFRNAISASSKQANELYPNLGGPSLLLNLPKLLGAIVKLFTPLFPAEVRKKIKFERGPLKKIDSLMEITSGSARQEFLSSLDELVYSD